MPGVEHDGSRVSHSYLIGPEAPAAVLFKHKFGDPEYLINYRGTNVSYPYYETLSDVEKFQARPGDVCVASVPKTGSMLTVAVAHMIMNNADPNSLLEGQSLDRKAAFLEFTSPSTPIGSRQIDLLNDRPSPRLYFTHLGYDALPKSVLAHAKIIYITRNVKDAILARYDFLKANTSVGFNGTLDDLAKAYMDNKCAFSPFFDHVAGYWKNLEKHDNILFITLEQVIKDFSSVIRRIAVFLGKDLTDEQVANVAHHCHFDNMQMNPLTGHSSSSETGLSVYVGKGKVGNWKEDFTPELNDQIDRWIKKEKARLADDLAGMEFEYE